MSKAIDIPGKFMSQGTGKTITDLQMYWSRSLADETG
jgi:hypothetical protein